MSLMHQDWSDFLQTQTLARHTEQPLMPLMDWGVIRVTGKDARMFLQGQFSNDITLVSSQQGQLSSYNTHKGRMLAIMWIFEHAGDLYLHLPKERVAAILKRLQMFVLRAQVQLHDASTELPALGLAGHFLQHADWPLPSKTHAAQNHRGATWLRLPDVHGRPRALVHGNAETLYEIWEAAVQQGAQPTESAHWRLLNIQSGIPTIFDATSEAFVPQMANLDLLDGISFTKGCYTGQEVIARMKYLGELKRRMFLAYTTSAQPISPGSPLYAEGLRSAQGAGKVVDAQRNAKDEWECLVVAVIEAAQDNRLHLQAANGPGLTIQPPPYGLNPND